MITTHEFFIRAKCPADQSIDLYQVIATTTKIIPVETITFVVNKITDTELYQEEITKTLARDIGCSIQTVGYHSGVKTTCVISI